MTPIPPIPEDLLEQYERAKILATSGGYLQSEGAATIPLIERIAKLTAEVERLREINFELVQTHNTLVVENARQERAIWKFGGDPRATRTPPQEGQ